MIQSIFSFIVQGANEAFFWLRAVFLNVGIDIVNFIVVCSLALFVLSIVSNSSSGLKRSYKDSEPASDQRSDRYRSVDPSKDNVA